MSVNEIFFELIRVALGTQESLSRPPTKAEWAELYLMSKKQSLVGICFAGVQKLYNRDNQEPSIHNPQPDSTHNHEPITHNLDEVQYLQWMGMAAKIQQRNGIANARCVEIQEMVEAAGFRAFIMKGQANALLYPEHLRELRQSGDIDIMLDGGFEKVNKYVQSVAPTQEINRLEIQLRCFEDVPVEIHYKPFYMPSPLDDRRLQKFFASECDKCFNCRISIKEVGSIAVGTSCFNIVHQMVHIWHHFFTEGVGMRQLMDYYFLLKSQQVEEPARQQVMGVMERMGLRRFVSGVMYIMRTVFGLEDEYLLCAPCANAGERILDEVMQKGNFGHYSENNLMKKSVLKRLFVKIGFAAKHRCLGHAPYFWIPARSIADRLWQMRHNYM